MHETVFVCQCVGEVGTDRPEVYSAAKCSVVAYSLVFISEVVSCTDYPVFQEVIFGADSCLKLADFGRKQIVEDADTKNSVCLDFGATYHRNMALLDEMASWSIGFQAANLGKKIDGYKLPAKLGLGGAIAYCETMIPFSSDFIENRCAVHRVIFVYVSVRITCAHYFL